MAGPQTIADSKRAFHQAFPHVIAPLHRRVADELLVELHLLSHQTTFQAGQLFAVGLTTVFERFTQGYRPEEHRSELMTALCGSNGFDANALKDDADKAISTAATLQGDALDSWLKELNIQEGAHYSRLMGVGLFALLEASESEVDAEAAEELRKRARDLAPTLGLPAERVEKDLSVFASSSERMQQAVELMNETQAAERRKKERRLAELAEKSKA